MEARRPSLFRKCWFEARDRYLRQVVFTVFFEIARRQGIDRGTRAVGRPHLPMDTSLPSLGVSTSAVSSKAEFFHVHAMQGPRTMETAWAVIQGIDAAQMMRKGQVLGITRQNLYGHAWVFATLLLGE